MAFLPLLIAVLSRSILTKDRVIPLHKRQLLPSIITFVPDRAVSRHTQIPLTLVLMLYSSRYVANRNKIYGLWNNYCTDCMFWYSFFILLTIMIVCIIAVNDFEHYVRTANYTNYCADNF